MSKLEYNNEFTFTIDDAMMLDYSYFPLTNGFNLKGSINANLNGDLKTDQNHFILTPITEDALKNINYGRNIYFNVNNDVYALNGCTPLNHLKKDLVTVSGGFLYYGVKKENDIFTTNSLTFCPYGKDDIELTKVVFKNNSKKEIKVIATVAIPLYCRSADTIRDHRHVTSLLNNAIIKEEGIINTPTLLFDEKSHLKGETSYAVFTKSNKVMIKNYWPSLEDFCKDGSDLILPKVVERPQSSSYKVNDVVAGYELLAGFEYQEIFLKPNEQFEIIFMITTCKANDNIEKLVNKYLDFNTFDNLLEENKKQWSLKLANIEFNLFSKEYSGWLKWVSLQPTLRRIFGCSFLPHHDYGKGGKGWRDLWQDCLALLYVDPQEVQDMLLNNFIGVRIDGSNATIIGTNKGEFKADRNALTRVWSDHGVWPYITVEKYLNITEDLSFLNNKQVYYKDKFSHYTKKTNRFINEATTQKTKNDEIYQGTILEHLIIQNVVPFYNVGLHGNLRLENADWNDGLDMASENGESVAFTSLYGANLISLGKLIIETKFNDIYLFKELNILLDNKDFTIENKKKKLNEYFNEVENVISGDKVKYNYQTLGALLISMGESFKKQVQVNEWMENKEDGYFCSYYDNDGKRLDDINKKRMILTGQVFALMGKVANQEQINKIIKASDKYLYSPKVGGYKLNTDFKEVKYNMGRLFGFAYGHKENGAMFSHMAIMYANGLYQNHQAVAGNKVLKSIFNQLMRLEEIKIYPGIPEYIDPKGRGMYHYLTGSASWLILTMIEEVFGVKREYGILKFEPQLLKEDFINNEATINTLINNSLVEIKYINKKNLDYGKYNVEELYIDDELMIKDNKSSFIKINVNKKNIKKIKIILN